MAEDVRLYDVAFAMLEGMNAENARRALKAVGSAEAFFALRADEIALALGCDLRHDVGEWRRRALEAARREMEFIAAGNIDVTFIGNADYPERLARCEDAPPVIYSVGSTASLDSRHMVAVVGTRGATTYGVGFTKDLVATLAQAVDDVVIVSGLAYGIDVAAHRAALAAGIPTVAVVAHGLNTIYPADHRDTARSICRSGGAIVTEYASGAKVHRSNFLARNRIVAGLCDVTVVVESDVRGGALATARLAQRYGREVCAVPGRAIDRKSRGCNRLIQNNSATLITDASDLVALMGWESVKDDPYGGRRLFDDSVLDAESKRVVDHLRSNPDDTSDDIAAALGMPLQRVGSIVTALEMDDVLDAEPGGTFSLRI